MATFLKTVRNTIKYWYLPAVIGVLFILMGAYLFSVPAATYFSLAIFFSLSFLFSGILEILFSIQNRKELEGWGWYLTSGIFSFLIGVVLVSQPGIAATALPFFVGFSLLFRSFQGLGFAFDLKNYGVMQWGNLAVLSILGIIFSFLLISNPIFAGISLVVLTAMSFIVTGVYAIVLSFQLKKLKSFPGKLKNELKDKIESLKEEYYTNIREGK